MVTVRDPAAFEREVLAEEGPVLALFYAEWCPFCRSYLPVFRGAEGREVKTVEVDISDDDNPLWDRYGVEVVPTLILFEEGGVVDRADGRLMRGLREEDLTRLLGQAAT